MKKVLQNKKLILLFLLIVYTFIHSCCIIITGDDFFWAKSSISEILSANAENGRYFTNLLVYFATRFFSARLVIFFLFYLLWFIFTSKIISKSSKSSFSSLLISSVLILCIPVYISSNVVYWTSGFVNYVIGSVLFFSYYIYCKPILEAKEVEKKIYWAPLMLILGFLSSLCVENITILCDIFAIFIIILSAVKLKKVHISNITYLLGAVVGNAFMFSNNVYSTIFGGKNIDPNGFRHVEISFSDMFMKIYSEIIPFFTREFTVIHAAIAVSSIFLYMKKFGSADHEEPKYGRFLLGIIAVFAVYSFCVTYINDFVPFTADLKIKAIETALTFLYIIALLYTAFYIIEKNDFIHFTAFVLCSVLVTAPFIAVNPVTPRCFFCSYVFWSLAGGRLLMCAVSEINFSFASVLKSFSVLLVGSFCFYYSYVSVSNKLVDILRVNYIKQQLDEGGRGLKLIRLPYQQFAADYIYFISSDDYKEEGDSSDSISAEYADYFTPVCEYFGFDDSIKDKTYVLISTTDYYMEKENSSH